MQFTSVELSILKQAAEIILRSQAPAPPEPARGNFTVTRDWINANRTPGGSWKAKQLRAIGVNWPPAGGWLERSKGKQISDAARLLFESFADKRMTGPDAGSFGVTAPAAAPAACGCDVPPWEDCIHTKPA